MQWLFLLLCGIDFLFSDDLAERQHSVGSVTLLVCVSVASVHWSTKIMPEVRMELAQLLILCCHLRYIIEFSVIY